MAPANEIEKTGERQWFRGGCGNCRRQECQKYESLRPSTGIEQWKSSSGETSEPRGRDTTGLTATGGRLRRARRRSRRNGVRAGRENRFPGLLRFRAADRLTGRGREENARHVADAGAEARSVVRVIAGRRTGHARVRAEAEVDEEIVRTGLRRCEHPDAREHRDEADDVSATKLRASGGAQHGGSLAQPVDRPQPHGMAMVEETLPCEARLRLCRASRDAEALRFPRHLPSERRRQKGFR